MSRLIGVYGSLRKGGYNHHRLRSNGAASIRQAIVKIPGRLYSLGTYSCAVPLSEGEDGEIVAEVYEVDDGVFQSLDAMERRVGYVARETTVTGADGVERTFIVWYHAQAPAGAVHVEEGDWVAYCRSRNQRY